MSKKAMLIGFEGEELTDKLKEKIESGIKTAIEEHNVTDLILEIHLAIAMRTMICC